MRTHGITGRPVGRPSIFNLLSSDYTEIAEHVSALIAKSGRATAIVVRDSGAVSIDNPSRFPNVSTHELVGIYTREAKVEFIEDDLLAHMRELCIDLHQRSQTSPPQPRA